MPYKEGQPTLMGFLGTAPVKKLTKTPLLGAPYILFGNLCEIQGYLYICGAILGHAKRSELSILAKMLAIPGSEDKYMNWLQEQASQRLNKFINEVGREPDTFHEFILFKELATAAGVGMKDWFKACADRNTSAMKLLEAKMPLEKADYIKMFGMEGIGFGSFLPELTETMYRNMENVDMDVWSEMKVVGFNLPEEPTPISLEEQEKIVLQTVAAYASEYYPELLDPLDLRGYIDTKGSR